MLPPSRILLVALLVAAAGAEHPHHARHHAKHNAPQHERAAHGLRLHAHGQREEESRGHSEEDGRRAPDYRVHSASEGGPAPDSAPEHGQEGSHYKKGTVKTVHGRAVQPAAAASAVPQVSAIPQVHSAEQNAVALHAAEVEHSAAAQNAAALHAEQQARTEQKAALRGRGRGRISCGVLTEQPDAKPADYKDARKTKYDKETKQMVKVTFSAGTSVTFKCKRGFTIGGTKGGDTKFDVECTEAGYYKPAKTCVEVTKCEDPPTIAHAHVSKMEGGKMEYSCDDGYSTDGEKVVEGGSGENSLFTIACQEKAGIWTKWEGECQPFNFMPTSKVIGIYNSVFGALFHHSCKNTIINEFGKLHGPNPGLDKVCGKLPKKEGDCSPLVDKIKSEFKAKVDDRKKYEKDQGKDWHEKDPNAPGIVDEADKFCEKLWGLMDFSALVDKS